MSDKSQRDPVERAFARFRARGRVADLAEVFDRSAPSLLLLACHFTRDAQSAEDIVQATFLHLLEHHDSFDPGRPLMPWLMGALANRARQHLRREALRRQDELPAEQAQGRERNPAGQAEDEELRLLVQDRIAALPEAYREVLALHLLHGLRPKEIAHCLGRPPASVRTQLRRGLERLRQGLPGSLVLPALALCASGAGLRAMRRRVLAALPAGTQGASLGKLWVLATALLTAMATAWSFWSGSRSANLDQEPTHWATAAPGPTAAGGASSPTRAGPPAQRVLLPTTRPDRILVTGRCLSEDDGSPLPDAEVILRATQTASTSDGDPYERSDQDLQRVRCDALGRYHLEVPLDQRRGTWLVCHAPGRLHKRIIIWHRFDGSGTLRLADCHLPRGAWLRGRFLDADGRRIPGVKYAIRARDGVRWPMRSSWSETIRAQGHSILRSADGHWRSPGPLRPGRYVVFVEGLASEIRREFEIRAGEEEVHGDLRLIPPRTDRGLQGRVLDLQGSPVPGLFLQFKAASGTASYQLLLPHADGRFSAAAITQAVRVQPHYHDSRESVRFQDVDEAGMLRNPAGWPYPLARYQLVEPERVYRPGPTRHEVRVRRMQPARLRLKVCAAGSGRAVEHFATWIFADPGEHWPEASPRLRRRHRGGILERGGLHPGRYFVCVYPDAPLAPRSLIQVELREGETSDLKVELGQLAPLQVHLHSRGGADLRNARIRVVDATLGRPSLHHHPVHQLEDLPPDQYSAQCFVHVGTRLWEGTDSVQVPVPAHNPRLFILVEHPRHLTLLRALDPVPAGGKNLRLTLDRGAVLRGSAGPPDVLHGMLPGPDEVAVAGNLGESVPAMLPQLHLEALGHDPGFVPRSHVGRDGRFCFGAVPAGAYKLWIETRYGKEACLAKLSLRGHETREVHLDLHPHRSVKVQGRLLDSKLIRLSPRIHLSGPDAFATEQVGPHGRFWGDRVPVGRYRLEVHIGSSGSALQQLLRAPDTIDLQADGPGPLRLDPVEHRLRILDPSGNPQRGRIVLQRGRGDTAYCLAQGDPDPEGYFTCFSLQGGSLSLHDQAGHHLADFVLPDTQQPAPLEIRIPAPASGPQRTRR